MMTIYLAPLVSLIGALVYGFVRNGRVEELGRIAFFCGLLATLIQFSRVVHLP